MDQGAHWSFLVSWSFLLLFLTFLMLNLAITCRPQEVTVISSPAAARFRYRERLPFTSRTAIFMRPKIYMMWPQM